MEYADYRRWRKISHCCEIVYGMWYRMSPYHVRFSKIAAIGLEKTITLV